MDRPTPDEIAVIISAWDRVEAAAEQGTELHRYATLRAEYWRVRLWDTAMQQRQRGEI